MKKGDYVKFKNLIVDWQVKNGCIRNIEKKYVIESGEILGFTKKYSLNNIPAIIVKTIHGQTIISPKQIIKEEKNGKRKS